MTQAQALDILKTGSSVFLTGEPGSGKTHTVNAYADYLRSRGIEPAITASTGIAATHIGGMTIHSWSGIGIRSSLSKHDLAYITANDYVVKRVRRAKVLVIDEISMLGPETLDMIDSVCRHIKNSLEPFGGIQIVLSGDFFQLPPIVKREMPLPADTEQASFFAPSRVARFAYDSNVWQRARPITCYLTEQFRQDDSCFLGMLSAIRRNSFNDEHRAHLETRRVISSALPREAPKLYTHNVDVDRVNCEMLTQLPGESRSFAMNSIGPEHLVATLKKGCLSPESLALKVGAAVMFTKNNPRGQFVNGTLGTVVSFDRDSGAPVVKTRQGTQIIAEPMEWVIEDNGKVLSRLSQFPLRLAWAITVHKSQGMSLEEAVMDLREVFEYGQGYVALSRVRRLSGLHLLGWNERAFEVHPEVLAKDSEFRTASADTEVSLTVIPETELQKQQGEFILRSGGKLISKKSSKKIKISGDKNIPASGATRNGFAAIREKFPNAYRSWSSAEDDSLRQRFKEGVKSAAIAKEFGRKYGAIRSRLKKLGLVV